MTEALCEIRLDAEDLRAAAQRLLADKVDRRAPWDERATGRPELEGEMTALGWYLLTAPEEFGGLGQDFRALAPIYEELGRALAPAWLGGTMAAVDLLRADSSPVAKEALRSIVEDGARMALVVPPENVLAGPVSLPMVAGADAATHLLVIPPGEGGCGVVAADAPGVRIEPCRTWDLGRGYAAVTLTGAELAPLSLSSARALDIVRAHNELALAWDSIGAATQCLAEAIDYMQGRHQFGRPIASFQALKHRLADHKVAIELARALTGHASDAYARRADGWRESAGQARLLAGEAFRAMGEDTVQLHGGVGFTWEYNCHLFLKRALMNQVLDETPDQLRDRIAPAVVARAFDPG